MTGRFIIIVTVVLTISTSGELKLKKFSDTYSDTKYSDIAEVSALVSSASMTYQNYQSKPPYILVKI